jgi:hypothetical protein
MAFLLFSFIFIATGTVLGLRFKVLVLAPVIAFTTIVIVTSNHDLRAAALAALGAAVLLQIGYLIGCMFGVLAPAQLTAPTTMRYHVPGSKTAH